MRVTSRIIAAPLALLALPITFAIHLSDSQLQRVYDVMQDISTER
jgi:hypothetical protein